MHVYIYDDFLEKNKYSRILAKIETRLTDLGLNGRIFRLGASKNINEIIRDELKKGAKTIIGVGGDLIINKILTSLANTSVPLGFIPIEKKSELANILGIPAEVEACDVLASRRIEKIDLGLANDSYFLSAATLQGVGIIVKLNDVLVEPINSSLVGLYNISTRLGGLILANDGKLNLIIDSQEKITQGLLKKQKPSQTRLLIENIFINSPNSFMLLDGTQKIACPVQISVQKEALRIIVGKNRIF